MKEGGGGSTALALYGQQAQPVKHGRHAPGTGGKEAPGGQEDLCDAGHVSVAAGGRGEASGDQRVWGVKKQFSASVQ